MPFGMGNPDYRPRITIDAELLRFLGDSAELRMGWPKPTLRQELNSLLYRQSDFKHLERLNFGDVRLV